MCWNGTPIVFHRFERKCVEGEKGLSAKMVGEKRTKTKLCRRDKTQEGSSSCRSSSSPSLGPSPVLLFLGKKKEREKEAESSQYEQLWFQPGRLLGDECYKTKQRKSYQCDKALNDSSGVGGGGW